MFRLYYIYQTDWFEAFE